MQRPLTVAIIGPGKVGCALGRRLSGHGFRVAAVAGRTAAQGREAVRFIGAGQASGSPAIAARKAECVLITTADRSIGLTAERIAAAGGFRAGQVVFHCSGAYGPELLAPARKAGAAVGALHPLQSFASAEQALRRLRGTFFTFEGDAAAAPAARRIVRAAGGRFLPIAPGNRALYHAASCVLSNYLVALADLGLEMMEHAGVPRAAVADAAQPLLRGTLENVKALGTPQALTGPVARGDVETVRRHMEALRDQPPQFLRLYAELGRYTVSVARRKGLRPSDAAMLMELFKETSGGSGE